MANLARPELVLIDGKPERSKGGTFYLEWREDGKRKTRPVGTTPREALNAWQLQTSIFSGTVEPPEEPMDDPAGKAAITIDSRCLLIVRIGMAEAQPPGAALMHTELPAWLLSVPVSPAGNHEGFSRQPILWKQCAVLPDLKEFHVTSQ